MNLKELLPLPSLMECKSILCIQPHPDDNEVGAGATIAKLAKSGCDITYLTVTDGRMGTANPNEDIDKLIERRKNEVLKASKILGVEKNLFLNFPDGNYNDEKEMAQSIVEIIRRVKPEFVMTVDPFLPYEVHPDHIGIGRAALQACLFSEFPFFNQGSDPGNVWSVKGVALYNTCYGNTIVDVDDTWELKFKAMDAHESQFFGEGYEMLKGYFELKSRELAGDKGFTHGEAFKILTPMLMHGNVDAIAW